MMKLRLSIIAIVLLSFACAPVVLAQAVPGSEDYQNGFGGAAPVDNTTWSVPLTPIFEAAATKYHVPLPILITLGYFGSAFENRGGAPTIEGGYGVMALRKNDIDPMGGKSLALAATLTAVSEETLKTDPAANINGAAAVLDYYATMWQIDRAKGIDAWLDVVITYAGLEPEYSRFFAMEIYEKLQKGVDSVNTSGERIALVAQGIGSVNLQSLEPPGARVSAGYSGATWYPAASCNYTASYSGKDTVVCHTIEGSAAGCLSWFRNCNAQVSAHYVVSEGGGVWQCVDENYKAWHVSCLNSRCLGIEHEGYAASGSHPTALYNASALLTRDMCNRWGIPKEKRTTCPGILGHIDVTHNYCGTHTDPGNGWNWSYYISQVQGAPPVPAYAASYNAQSYPSTMTAGSTAIAWAEYKNNGTAVWGHAATNLGTQGPQDRDSPFYNAGNWISARRPTEVDQSAVSQNQIGRFTFILKAPTAPGTYTEKYRLVQEGVTWFGDEITWTITVTAATGNITGTVRNIANGTAISGATVAIVGGASTTTNSSGVYTFTGLAPAPYNLTASKAGFTSAGGSATVTAGGTATVNFDLTSTDATPPSTPTALSATGISPSQINLSWTGSTDTGGSGLAGYIIYRNSAEVGRTTAVTYQDNGLAQNTSYSYFVKAYDNAGNVSAASNTASDHTLPGTVAIFQDGFPNLNGWTADVVADSSSRGVAWNTTHNNNIFAGGGNAETLVGGGAVPGTNGCWSYKSFPRPFAAGRYEGYFYDTGTGNSRQGIHLRGYSGAIVAFSIYIGTYSPSAAADYFVGIYGLGEGAWVWQSIGARGLGWHKFTIELLPYTGLNDMKFYVGDSAVPVYTTNRPLATNTYGISKTYLGHNYNVNQVGWFDDLAFYAEPPLAPIITAPTALTTSINWNYTDNSNKEAGFDLHDAAQTQKGTVGMNTNCITESGLVANTSYTRHLHAYNGTLSSLPTPDTTRWTLSVPPTTSNVTCDKPTGLSSDDTFTFTAVGGFGQGTVAKYLYVWDTSPTHAIWTGSETEWGSGVLIRNAPSVGSYYLHVQGLNGENAVNGALDLGPYTYQNVPPTNPTSVVETHGALTEVWQSTVAGPSFTWSGATAESGIAGYLVYFGTDPVGTSTDLVVPAAYTPSPVTTGAYYLRLRTKDNAGNLADEWMTGFEFKYDSSAPAVPTVADDGDYTGSKTLLHALWWATDSDSDIEAYQYAVGTSVGGTEVLGWSLPVLDTDKLISIPDPGLSVGPTYYVSVKAKNTAGLWSDVGSSDGIQLAADALTIGAAKLLANDTPVALQGKTVAARFVGSYYIEETNRSSGILVLGPGPDPGAIVTVAGLLTRTTDGERAIESPSTIATADAVTSRIPKPIGMLICHTGGGMFGWYTYGDSVSGFGLNNVGLLIRVCGQVGSLTADEFTIDDHTGRGPIKVLAAGVALGDLANGDTATVTGVCSLILDTVNYRVAIRVMDGGVAKH